MMFSEEIPETENATGWQMQNNCLILSEVCFEDLGTLPV